MRPPMKGATGIQRLSLSCFRSYKALDVVCDPSTSVILTGVNGAGKTNILEALSFFSPGKGLRGAKLSDIICHLTPDHPWAAAITLQQGGETIDIGTGLDPVILKTGRERRVVHIHGEPQINQSILTHSMSVIWLTPYMDHLFIESASERRRFLDRLVFGLDGQHASRIQRYEYAMRERARLLRDGKMDHHWLTALEERMVEEGYAIAKARLVTLDQMHASMRESIGAFPQASLKMMGAVEEWALNDSFQAIEDKYKGILQSNRFNDAASGITTFGPHRSDLEVCFGHTKRLASQCSTGEQKALLISIILASARAQAESRENRPILLLDEVIAHLDPHRREALFGEIEAIQMQAWMTGTECDIFKSLKNRTQFFHIENSQLITNAVESRAVNK